jgi:hypothetical protein
LRMVTPAAIEASSILRLVSIVSLPGFALSSSLREWRSTG